jgi:hypothetical protein
VYRQNRLNPYRLITPYPIMSPAVHAHRMVALDRSSPLRAGHPAHEGSPARYGPTAGQASDNSPRSAGDTIRYSPRSPLVAVMATITRPLDWMTQPKAASITERGMG